MDIPLLQDTTWKPWRTCEEVRIRPPPKCGAPQNSQDEVVHEASATGIDAHVATKAAVVVGTATPPERGAVCM